MHPRLRLLAPVLLAATLLSSAPAFAGVPSAANSEVPAQLLLCPYEALPFTVVVRDAANNPVEFATVQLILTSCLANPYVGTPTHRCPNSGLLSVVSNASGSATFMVKAGGVCRGNAAQVLADGVLLAFRSVASPDQDGNLVVLGQDSAILVAKQMSGSFDATADLDGDGNTNNDQGDYDVYDLHAGHGCDAITPALPRSWGSVKLLYR